MKKIVGVLGVAFCLMLAGCASQKQDTIEKRNTDISKDLTYDHSMELEYAKMFAVDYYQNDYALVTIADDGKYLIVPEGESVPEDMDKDITVLQQPIQNIYLAASAAMDMFVATDALDAVRFSSLKADGWYIEEGGRKSEGVINLSHVKKAVAQAMLLVVGIAMLCFGVWRGEAATVLSKAIKLCLE